VALARRSDPTFTLLYELARLRRPVRLLQRPDWASLLHPGGLPQVLHYPAAGAGAGFMRLSGRRHLAPSGDWDSGSKLSPYRAGPPARRPWRMGTAAGFL